MRFHTRKRVTQEVLTHVTCDKCSARVEADDTIELQEWIVVSGSGGYGSKHWGDGTRWWLDLCEECQHELFGVLAHIDA